MGKGDGKGKEKGADMGEGERTEDGLKGGREQGMGEEIGEGATEYIPLHIYATWAVTIATRQAQGCSVPQPQSGFYSGVQMNDSDCSQDD